MDDDFTLKYEGKDYPSIDDLKALQTQAVCILATRFGHKTPHSTLGGIGGDSWRGGVMKRLLVNAAESLDKENPFPTFEITGVLTKEDFIRRGYGTGFYIFQSIVDEEENDVAIRYFSLVYLDVKSSNMIQQWLAEEQDEVEGGREFVWVDGNLKGESEWKWVAILQLGPAYDWWRHSVSFLGTSCANSPLKGTGIINWTTI